MQELSGSHEVSVLAQLIIILYAISQEARVASSPLAEDKLVGDLVTSQGGVINLSERPELLLAHSL